jgi:Methyltransferase domain
MLEQITWLLEHFPCFKSICEIGTGNGLLIDHLAGSLTGIERFQGIDLSAEQIARNRANFAESKVEYLHVEATDYVVHHGRPGTLFVTCGTFECFAQAELEELLALTRSAVDRVSFAICDAVATDFNPSVELDSRPRGNLFFSHNYRYLLEKHGYDICFDQVEFPKPIYNRVSILATSFPRGAVKSHTQTID